MNILTVDNITKSYGVRKIFDGASFFLQEGEKAGIIGINGTGKSTLLKMIAGLEEADDGTVIKANHCLVRYLPQNPEFAPEETVLEAVLRGNRVEENAEIYAEILPFAKSCGVKIATENMWNWNGEKDESCFAACATSESFNAHLDAVNDPFFVACLDIGHAEMRGSGSGAANMIYALGDRLQALHLHDNDKWHDSHQIPFSMDIDFMPIVKALKDIGYKGYFTLEADSYLNNFNAGNIFDGLKDLSAAARKLASMFDK